MVCSERDPVTGLECLDTSGCPHRQHYAVGRDSEGEWHAAWMAAADIRATLLGRRRLDGDESYPEFSEVDDARAGAGLPSWTAGSRSQGGLIGWLHNG